MIAKPKLLIVDDVEANRIALRRILKGVNVHIFEVDNGFDALSLALEHQFALILLDVLMPDLDGFDVCEQLRANSDTEQMPIIFISALLKNEEHRIMGYLSGATDYITKPINPQILLSKVQIFLKLYQQQQQLIEVNNRLQQLVDIDSLTGIANRRAFYELSAKEFDRFKRYHRTFSLALLDLDFFKRINDTYGHQAGDKVLVEFAALVSNSIRSSDIFARVGGEEFLILFPETNVTKASIKLNDILRQLRKLIVFWEQVQIKVNCSIGLTTVREGDESLDKIIGRADIYLYQAKDNGRDHLVCEGESIPSGV